MKLRNYLIFVLLALAACKKELHPMTAVEDVAVFNNRADRPNIVVALVDDWGFECLTINGGRSYSTPNIDRLARQGTRFTNCFSCPLCSPSRKMLLTGKLGFRNYTGWGDIGREGQTIANVLKAGGYATGAFGKWQLGGGDTSIRASGFDDYCVHDALDATERKSRYRDPHLYTHGGFLPDSATLGKYGDDIVQDSLVAFLRRNAAARIPTFSYYAIMLAHKPFQPTPDDPNYSTWNLDNSDTTYYPSMVKYMDKLIGRLKDSIAALRLNNSTMLIITGDNGTPGRIHSWFDTILIPAGKGKTTLYGTHVPLIVYWHNHTPAGVVDSSLIGFQDFLPTIADAANVPYLPIVDTTDGVSFYHNIVGQSGYNRQVLYQWFNAYPEDEDDSSTKGRGFATWVQNANYKMYDSCTTPPWRSHKMFNMYINPLEDSEIPFTPTTPYEMDLQATFINTINYYRR